MMPPDTRGQHPHYEGGHRRDTKGQRLGRAVGGVSGEAGRVEPEQGLAARTATARDPDEERSARCR